ncbi:DNA-binding response regulator [Geminocystis sp. NIES-3708]|uniref:response regulator transcription factor n=1 Tax=Geminocystis sp. NIES-3708 TaxID=1615909 RepID=UPI0005FC5F8E|nr:response regulator transcription factor [Geminocystis sp. NIES-3708]BAQ61230.1 DNA-binding response regulator [Geminocystis sp. NIES-3708]
MRLLLIEDDPDLSNSIKAELKLLGYAADVAFDGEEGEFLGTTESYDVVILDLGLPKMSGLEVLKLWRQAGNNVPVIVLTARDAWHEKVDGFKAGADDYLGKPFHFEELLARLQAVLKRVQVRLQEKLSLFGIELDEEQQSVSINGQKSVILTALEFRLLRYLMTHPNRVLSKYQLMEHIYEYDGDPESNVIEVYINRLRHIVGKDLIINRRGQGYLFGKNR